ncbi:hypothetical protein TRAPUB_11714 [Trametes pubescens]|uniref:Uncharacterized protein n=1 Tax=Trametes pubescens TaxID=154538 RepID=A0A1M2W829_TRAPU|nr:hypothetical protein TRAPUB_11714 [Trametes pubescens]
MQDHCDRQRRTNAPWDPGAGKSRRVSIPDHPVVDLSGEFALTERFVDTSLSNGIVLTVPSNDHSSNDIEPSRSYPRAQADHLAGTYCPMASEVSQAVRQGQCAFVPDASVRELAMALMRKYDSCTDGRGNAGGPRHWNSSDRSKFSRHLSKTVIWFPAH